MTNGARVNVVNMALKSTLFFWPTSRIEENRRKNSTSIITVALIWSSVRLSSTDAFLMTSLNSSNESL
jgi:hypothetical protein